MEQTNGKAVASLVCGIIALILMWFGWGALVAIVLAIVGIVLGVGARKEIGAGRPGAGLATAGMVCSIIALALAAIVFVACVLCASAFLAMGAF